MIVFEIILFVLEMAQMTILGWQSWVNIYNGMNIASILLLLMAAAGYLVAEPHVELLEIAGSVGLGLKWLGLLGYLDSFQCKSPVHICSATQDIQQ